jgi:predicted LPLAT superfamily acyltransferase
MKAESATARHWAAVEENSLVWGIRVLVGVYRICGRWVFRLFLRPVVSYYFLAGRLARQSSLDYLRHLSRCYPDLQLGSGYWQSYRHFLSFGETLLDKIVVWTGNITPEQVDFPNRQLLLDLIEQKRGAMLLSGHIGNLEICQAIATVRGHIHLNILVHTKHAEKFNRLLGSRGSATVQLIQVTELSPAIAISLQEKIERGEFLVMVGDRVPVQGGRTVPASFLGEDAEFPQGPYLLASLLRCPVFTLFCFPVNGRFKIHLEPFSESIRIPRAEPKRQELLQTLTRQYAERLEGYCRLAPLQWFNFYPYWSKAAAGDSDRIAAENN